MHLREVRQTFHRLGKNRGFSCSVVLTLALGIGATVSVFSIIHAVMITPLPYHDPSRLLSVFESKMSNDEADKDGVAPGNFLDFRAQNQSFTDLAAYFGPHFNLTGHGPPKQLRGGAVTSTFFSILGAQPMMGRTFLPDGGSLFVCSCGVA
jgi:putative ABC transport system permease protein